MLFPQILSQGMQTEKNRVLTEFWLWSLAGIESKRGVKSVGLPCFHLQWVIMDGSVCLCSSNPAFLSVWGFLWVGSAHRCSGLFAGAQLAPTGSITQLAPGTHSAGWATLKQGCYLGNIYLYYLNIQLLFVTAHPASKTPWQISVAAAWRELPEALPWTCLHWAGQGKGLRQRCWALWGTSRCLACCFGHATATVRG